MSLNDGSVGADDRSSINAIWPVRAISEIDTRCIGNGAPVADAGGDGFAEGGDLWMLDGTGSHDSEGDPLTYWWQQILGPIIELNGPTTAQPTFIAPLEGGEVLVRLTVDDACHTDTDEVVVTVNPAPVCGNGVVEGSESCDDGWADECGACNATCSGPGSGSTCGDGVLCPETESCDDGWTDECGACNATCSGPGSGSTCGDGILCPETEFCDDGSTDECGACNVDSSAPGTGAPC
jgi:hypothetical protein